MQIDKVTFYPVWLQKQIS